MKQLGNTPQGGAIIELTPAEQLILQNALEALAGSRRFANPFRLHPVPDEDVSPLFEIMVAWTEMRIDINHIRGMVDAFQGAIEGREKP